MGFFDANGSIEQRKYRLTQMADLCPSVKKFDLGKMVPAVFEQVEQNLLKEARVKAHNSGRLFPTSERDDGGRKVTTFEGDPMAWMKHHMSPGIVATINRDFSREETVKLQPGQRVQIVKA